MIRAPKVFFINIHKFLLIIKFRLNYSFDHSICEVISVWSSSVFIGTKLNHFDT